MRNAQLALVAMVVTAAVHLTPHRAQACGGLFCNSSQPVNQVAERIVFSVDDEGRVIAIIEVQYQGPSERFAWVLPVAGEPEVGVSSTSVLDALQAQTNPQYTLTTRVEGTCRTRSRSGTLFGASGDDSDAPLLDAGVFDEDEDGPPPVTVVDRGSAGPYDYVVISVNPELTDRVDAARQWLGDNGFDIPEATGDALLPYLEQDLNLIAFRLTSGRSTGSIRPIMLSFGSGSPAIPIRPTALAADPDMGVMVFVVGGSRAVPINYRLLELNEALINWFSPGSTYDSVITRAADEAGGQGFVTEFAGNAEGVIPMVWTEQMEAQWQTIAETNWNGQEARLFEITVRAYQRFEGMRDVLREHDLERFIGCFECLDGDSAATRGALFDTGSYLRGLAQQVVMPLRETQAVLERGRYLTRLYTTMSPHEMTLDPMFDFNDDLGDLDNNHQRERVIECSDDFYENEAPWRVELDDVVVRGLGANGWPLTTPSDTFPANRRIWRVGTEGAGEMIVDNQSLIASEVAGSNRDIDDQADELARGGLCAVGAIDGRASGSVLIGLLVLVALRRRR